jgi:hypothetical protein
MKTYEIKNLSSTSVYLEDLGIRLNGKGATARISEDTMNASKSIKEMRSMLALTPIKPVPVWPFSGPSVKVKRDLSVKQDTPPAPPVPEAPKNPIVVDVHVPAQDTSKMDALLDKMTNLLSSIGSLTEMASRNITTSAPSASTIIQGVNTPLVSDPIFIPSKIVPDAKSVQVSLSENKQDRPDIEEATKSLKKLRGKK